MYKVAIIQNDSEMMRYSWADIRPMVHRLGYSYDGYTASDLQDLFHKIEKYDALIIATNACNDTKVRSSLIEHSAQLMDFLSKGKGLSVLFQMKKDEHEFFQYLPEELQIKTIRKTEDLKAGDIIFEESNSGEQILCFPHKIEANKIKAHCLHNNHVSGLYWTYLQPTNADKYNILLKDTSFGTENRPLVLSTRQDLPFRIVASAIALDWQAHNELWENTIRYVVEGKTHVALLTKTTSTNYDYKYLTSWLKVNKIPSKIYCIDNPEINQISLEIHSIYLVDPIVAVNEISEVIAKVEPIIQRGKAEIIFFNSHDSNPYIAIVSNIRLFHTIAKNAIIWTKGQFPNDHGYFAKSFWNTVDVITTLTAFGEPTAHYKDKIIEEINKHDRGGCYDEVLGATCAMFEVYHFYLGENHIKTQTALQWILENYKSKVLFEKASAIDVLIRFNYTIEEKELEAFKDEVMTFFTINEVGFIDNEFKIYRFCQTLFICGYTNEAKQLALKFINLQDKQDGKWVNVSHTAAVVELLINIQDKEHDIAIDEIIFKGVEYLYDKYDTEKLSWNNDVLSTVKSLRALKLFEEKVKLPVDVIKHRIVDESKRINSFSAIDTVARLNLKYINESNYLSSKLNEQQVKTDSIVNITKQLKNKVRFFIFSTTILLLLILLITYIVVQNGLFSQILNHTRQTVVNNIGTIAAVLAGAVIWVALIYLHTNNLIPNNTPIWLKKFIARIVPQPGFSITTESDKSD